MVLEACRKAAVKRYVFASSLYVYGKSGGFYRCSKQSCEVYIENYQAMFVCSGAPQEEVCAVLRERGLDGYFDGIHGSPPAKAVLLANIVKGQKLDPADVLMVGDAPTDRDAAETVGTLFYGVGPELTGGSFPWGEDLKGLSAWIAAHV